MVDIHTLLKKVLQPIFGGDMRIVHIPDVNTQSSSQVITFTAVPIDTFVSGPAGGAWTFRATFRVMHSDYKSAFDATDLLYRAVHALQDDGVFVEDYGYFGAVDDVIPPQLTGSTILPGNKNLYEFLAAFSIVATR